MTVVSESVRDCGFFERILAAAICTLGQPDRLSVGVEAVGQEEIRAVNAQFRGIDRPTDVLSFPTLALKPGERVSIENHSEDVDAETGELYLGDILLCEEIARAQAAEYGHSEERERGYLFCHAVLHLFGYDHMTETDRKTMREREEAVMREIKLFREESDADRGND